MRIDRSFDSLHYCLDSIFLLSKHREDSFCALSGNKIGVVAYSHLVPLESMRKKSNEAILIAYHYYQ